MWSKIDFALRRAGAKILEKSKKFPKFQRQIRKAGGTKKVPPLGSADIFGDNRKLRFGEITAALRQAQSFADSGECLCLGGTGCLAGCLAYRWRVFHVEVLGLGNHRTVAKAKVCGECPRFLNVERCGCFDLLDHFRCVVRHNVSLQYCPVGPSDQ